MTEAHIELLREKWAIRRQRGWPVAPFVINTPYDAAVTTFLAALAYGLHPLKEVKLHNASKTLH